MEVEITCSIRKPLLQNLWLESPQNFGTWWWLLFVNLSPKKGRERKRVGVGGGGGVEGGVVILGDQIFISEIQVSTIFCLANNFVSLPFVGIFYFLNCFLKRNYFIVSLFAKRCTSHCQCSFAILAFYIYALERTCFPLFI